MLFFAGVVFINAEAFVANRVINTLVADEGFFVPEVATRRESTQPQAFACLPTSPA